MNLQNFKKENGKRAGGADLDLPKIRRNPYIEVISINTGCLNNCTYCKGWPYLKMGPKIFLRYI